MAYNVELADRIRAVVQPELGLTEQRMFGGLAFLIRGNMAVSASSQGGLLLRIDPAASGSLITEPHVRRFEMRPEDERLAQVADEAVEDDDELRRWVSHGVRYARSRARSCSREICVLRRSAIALLGCVLVDQRRVRGLVTHAVYQILQTGFGRGGKAR